MIRLPHSIIEKIVGYVIPDITPGLDRALRGVFGDLPVFTHGLQLRHSIVSLSDFQFPPCVDQWARRNFLPPSSPEKQTRLARLMAGHWNDFQTACTGFLKRISASAGTKSIITSPKYQFPAFASANGDDIIARFLSGPGAWLQPKHWNDIWISACRNDFKDTDLPLAVSDWKFLLENSRFRGNGLALKVMNLVLGHGDSSSLEMHDADPAASQAMDDQLRWLDDHAAPITDDQTHIPEAGQVCSICHDTLSNDSDALRKMACGSTPAHVFHQKCVDDWIFEHNTCPLCRHRFTDVDLKQMGSKK